MLLFQAAQGSIVPVGIVEWDKRLVNVWDKQLGKPLAKKSVTTSDTELVFVLDQT
jgi:hypothetical protein